MSGSRSEVPRWLPRHMPGRVARAGPNPTRTDFVRKSCSYAAALHRIDQLLPRATLARIARTATRLPVRQGQRKGHPRPLLGRHHPHPAVVSDDDFLDEGEAETGAARLGGEEGTEHALGHRRGDPRPVVADDDAEQLVFAVDRPVDGDARRDTGIDARFERIAEQVADRLAQQHIVSLDPPEVAAHEQLAAARLDLAADIV